MIEIEVEIECPHCHKKFVEVIDLDDLDEEPEPPKWYET